MCGFGVAVLVVSEGLMMTVVCVVVVLLFGVGRGGVVFVWW